MHFALINWITASLPSHANLLGRLPVPLLLSLSFPFILFSFPLKFFQIYSSFICHSSHLVPFLFHTHTQAHTFSILSFRLIIILSALHAFTTLSPPCFPYPFFSYNVWFYSSPLCAYVLSFRLLHKPRAVS